MKVIVATFGRRPPAPPKLKCPICGKKYCGRTRLAKHAITKHQVRS